MSDLRTDLADLRSRLADHFDEHGEHRVDLNDPRQLRAITAALRVLDEWQLLSMQPRAVTWGCEHISLSGVGIHPGSISHLCSCEPRRLVGTA